MITSIDAGYSAFAGERIVATGEIQDVAKAAKTFADTGAQTVLVFDRTNGKQVEIDFRGTDEVMLARLSARIDLLPPTDANVTDTDSPRGPGRPKLGVVAREVTLLPRQWDWLGRQPGGASVAIRKIVDDARRASAGKDRIRESQEATYRFMSAMAGDFAGFEEASRALFAGNRARFDQMTAGWPTDIAEFARQLAVPALESAEPALEA